MNDIIERLGTLLTTRFGLSPDEFSADTTMRDLDLDSLALVEFGLIAEREFGIKIGEQEISLDDALTDVAKVIASKVA